MARVALTVAGGVVGSFFGAPGVGSYLGGALGGYIEKTQQDPVMQEGPRLDDLHVQTSTYGTPIYKIWGTVRIGGNIIWADDITEVRSENTTESQKGSPKQVQVKYSYYATFAIALCEGPVESILRIWADSDLIYDNTALNDQVVSGLGGFTHTLYTGSEVQTPDPTMQAVEGIDNIPAFRGLAYVVFENFPLEKFNNRIPNFSFDVSTSTSESLDHEAIMALTEQSNYPCDTMVIEDNDLYVTTQNHNYWERIHITSGNIAKSNYLANYPSIQTDVYGAKTGNFDIDERGIIHTTKGHHSTGVRLAQIDSTTLEVIKDADSALPSTHWENPYIRCFRNPSYPYVLVMPYAGSAYMHIYHRDTYILVESFPSINFTGCYWKDLHVDDDTGIIYYLKGTYTGNASDWMQWAQLNTDGTVNWADAFYHNTNCPGANLVQHDTDSGQIILASSYSNKISFYDDTSPYTHLATIDMEIAVRLNLHSAWRNGVIDGYLIFTNAMYDDIHRINVNSHTLDRTWDLADSTLEFQGANVYHKLTHSVISFSVVDGTKKMIKVTLDRGGATFAPLIDIIEDICIDAGLNTDQVDTTDLSSELVYGFVVNDQMRARAAIQVLMDAYMFDAVESDGQLVFVKRGGSSVVTIPEANLAAHESDGQRPDNLVTTRQQELELPNEVRLTYIDPVSNYLTGVQRARRLITSSKNILDVKLPLIMESDAAKQVCDIHLANAWMQRNRHVIIVPWQYAYLNPTDIITVIEDGNTHIMRIEEISYGKGLLTFKTVNENSSVYISTNAGAIPPTPPTQEVKYPGATELAILDIPLLQSSDDFIGIYIATQGYTDDWNGAVVERSGVEGILTWSAFASTTKDAVIGRASNALADVVDPFIWDEGNTVNIQLLDSADTLSNHSESDVIGGYNIGILGGEIIQWQYATLEDDGSYTLSRLLRGRKGSDYATGTHAVGEKFTVLDMDKLVFVLMNQEDKDQSIQFRTTSVGMAASTSKTIEETISINNTKPLSPQHIAGVRDGSGNLTISWIRRTRIMGEWRDNYDVSLGETSEEYEVDIYDGSVLMRTIDGLTTPETTYTAAQQTTDFGSPQSSIDVEVFQISSAFTGAAGRGHAGIATI